MPVTPQPGIVLPAVLRALRPFVRLLVRHGLGYPALAAELKPLFLDEARRELTGRGMSATDSALTLLSGVHRRDVRRLTRGPELRSNVERDDTAAVGPVAELVGRWLTDPAWLDDAGAPRTLARAGAASFDELASAVSRDVRPRAMLDELVRLGVVEVDDEGVRLLAPGFAPRAGYAELASLFAGNLHDHAAAAVANLGDDANFLEQAVFVDELTAESVKALQQRARQAWQAAMRQVLDEARRRFDHDAAHAAPTERTHRARFGAYFYDTEEPAP